MLLALFDPATDKSLSDISLIIGGLTAAVYYTKEIFWGKPAQIPNPLQTQKVWPSATIKELESASAEVNRRLAAHDTDLAALRELIRTELPAMERRIATSNEERAVHLHDRINDVLEAVSELRGEVKNRN
jgi:hypothetical protein